jgi:hypothetical protein
VERFQKRYGKTVFTKAGDPADESAEAEAAVSE